MIASDAAVGALILHRDAIAQHQVECAVVAYQRAGIQPLLVDATYPLAVTVDGLAVAAGDLEVDADAMPATVTLPTGTVGKVVATYWGGVAPGTPVAPQIRAALLMYVEHLFKNRGVLAEDTAVELPQAFEALLASESHDGGW